MPVVVIGQSNKFVSWKPMREGQVVKGVTLESSRGHSSTGSALAAITCSRRCINSFVTQNNFE